MKTVKTTYVCDKCGEDIADVAYTLTCYAEDVNQSPEDTAWGMSSAEVANQNIKQNFARVERHLCRACKDAITDGVFIV